MNSRVQQIVALCAVAALPALAMAAEASPVPGAKQGLATGITGIIIFILCAAILGTKVWPTIGKALDERSNKIRDEIAAAELAREQAKAALDQYEQNLAKARAEAQAMLDQAKTQQQNLAAELRAKADTELNMMREKAKRDIDAAKRAAINEIYSQTISLATSAASKILQREVRPDDQDRLMRESMEEMQAMAASRN
jgi:F-type H+-transporting ATPase subunit b